MWCESARRTRRAIPSADEGLSAARLLDLPAVYPSGQPGSILPEGYRFPRFMLLAFTQP